MSGSVAGNSMGDFSEMDGMAPDAKISFFDIGERVVICILVLNSLPLSFTIFDFVVCIDIHYHSITF